MKRTLIASTAAGLMAIVVTAPITSADDLIPGQGEAEAFSFGPHNTQQDFANRLFQRGGPSQLMFRAGFDQDKDLTLDQVRAIVEGHLAMRDLENLQVGEVRELDEDVAEVLIETKDGSLVETRKISRKTGLPVEAEARFKKMRERMKSGDSPRGRRMMQRMGRADRDLNLNNDQVRDLAEARLIIRGNERLQIAKVEDGKENTAVVTIETVDGSIVDIISIDRDSGRRTNYRG